jgi:RNA polymerase sigma-70 factor (ECF subfamily)
MNLKHTLTEAELQAEWAEVQAAQQNPAHFRGLYNRYYQPIFRFVFTRVLDQEQTADLTAQVFLKAMQHLSKYSYKGVPFSAWLYRIALNEINQFFRQNNRRPIVSLEDHHTNDLAQEIDDKAGFEINLQQLKAVIQQLDPDELIMVELRFFEKRSFKEIGDIIEITENNAKVKMYRLLQKMKKMFEQSQPAN